MVIGLSTIRNVFVWQPTLHPRWQLLLKIEISQRNCFVLSWNLDCSSIIMRCLYSFFSVKFCILVIFQIMQIKFYFHTLLLQIYFSKIMPHFPTKWPYTTGICLIQKIYAPSSSLLQGKHLPFSPSPLCFNIFRLFVILLLTQLYRSTPEIFLFSTATFKYTYQAPLRWIGQE